jgi:hypothetical protein
MKSFIKRGAILIFAFFAFNQVNAQIGTKILYIDSVNQMEPIIMFDTTDFAVHVVIDDTSFVNNDSISGDLFYYYLTDSMMNAGAPPRAINDDTNSITINGAILDTVHVDIRPDEVRTTPVNLIILWPALHGPFTNELTDTDSVAIYVGFDGYAGLPPMPEQHKHHVIFPCPAIQYLFIRQEELHLIRQIRILSMDGRVIASYESNEFSSGFINVDTLPAGNYFVEINYSDKEAVRTKIQKR